MSDATPEAAAPAPDAPPAFEPRVFPGFESFSFEDVYLREVLQRFSASIRRPIVFHNPHRPHVETAYYKHFADIAEGNGAPEDAYHVFFFTVPYLNHPATLTGDTSPLRGRHVPPAGFPLSEHAVMFDSHPYGRERFSDALVSASTRWATNSGQALLGLPDFLPNVMRHPVGNRFDEPAVRERLHQAGLVTPIFSNSAFMPIDLPHVPYLNTSSLRLIEEWLNEHVAPAVLNSGEEAVRERLGAVRTRIDAIAEEMRARERERALQNMQAWAERFHGRRIQQARTEAEQLEQRIAEARLRYITAVNQQRDLLDRIAGMSDTDPLAIERAIDEVKHMLETGRLESAHFDPDDDAAFSVTTRTIYVQDDRSGAYHEIGRVQMTVNMATGAIQFSNLDRAVDGCGSDMHHPHIWAHGGACMGNFAEMLVSLIENQDWVGLIEASILFLESVNTRDGAGWHVHKWPFVPDPEAVGLPPYPHEVEPFHGDASDEEEEEEEDDPEIYDEDTEAE